MMEKPKKERRFLKTLGRVGEILIQEVLLKVGSNLIKRIGGKKQIPSILFLFLSISLFAQYPTNPNKQRLGFQTTADGLVWRGSLSDTASIQPVSNQNAWVILDTVNLKIYSFDFTSNVWGLVGGGSAAFTQPVDSLFFNVNVPTDNVDTAKMRWDSDLATVVLGLNDNVANELGFKNFWLVKNQTGSTITKGSLVYANGTVGASGRVTVAKFIANGTIDAKYLLGITAHDLSNGEDGYVISFGKIRKVKTDTFAAGAILYPSPTVAGVWTDVEPIAPNLDMPIGFCINSHANNGTIAIRVASGYALHELHDVAISSPVDRASLYYRGGLWRDTTPTLLVSDTASMLANYATKAYADTSGRFYARQDFTNVSSSTLTWTQSDTLVVGGVNVVQVYRNGQILLPTQYTIPTNASVVIGATAYKVGENYTVIFPRGGGAGSGGGSGSLTSISGGTGILVSPNPITTTGTVSADTSFLFTQSDTLSLNLTNRFALKLNATDTASLSTRIDAKGTGTVTSVGSGFGLLGGTITTTGTLRLDTTTIYARLQDSINVAIGGDTIKILKQEYNAASSSVLTWTITPKFPIQLKAYILVFRNGQLLNNDQYNLTDTNKITIVSTSFKIGANYTVATVSGIGSVGSAQAGNPVYPEAGIALSTGSTWASSITNNSSNWNTAYNDKVNSLAVTGTTTKTITLTQQDGGTVSGNFTDNGTVTSVGMTVPTGLAISGQPITTSGTLALSYASGYSIPTDIKQNEWNTAYNDKINNAAFTGTTTKTLTLTQLDGGTITAPFTDLQGVTGVTAGTGLTGGTITMTGTLAADTNFLVTRFDTSAMLLPYLRKSDTTNMLLPYFRDTDTTSLNLTSRFATKLNYTDTSFLFTQSDTNQLNLTNRFNLKANLNSPTFTGTVGGITKSMVGLGNVDNTSDANKPISTATQTALNLKFNTADTTSLNLTSRFATKLNYTDTSFLFTQSDTSQLNLTTRFAAKQNILNGTGFVKASGTNITFDNSSYLRTGLADSTYLKLTGGTLTGQLNGTRINIGTTSSSANLNVDRLLGGANGTLLYNSYFKARADGTELGGGIYTLSGITVDNSVITSSGGGFVYNNRGIVINQITGGTYNTNLLIGTEGTYNVPNNNYSIYNSSAYPNYFNGDVGIGTTSPNFKLDVTGTLGVTGATTLTGALNVSALSSPLTVNSTNSNTYKFNLSSSGVVDSYFGSNNVKLFSIADKNVNELFFIDTLGKVSVNATGVPININSINNNFYKLSFSNTNSGIITSYLGSDASKSLSIANSSANEVAYITYLGDAAFNGNITEAGNNVLTNLDTVSLSNRINAKYNSSGGTISGAVTLSTTTATPSTLLGKDGSNVVGTVTTLAQTGLMTRDIVTNASTISGSELINVTHGFITEPTAVLLTVFGSTSYILQVASKNSSTFTVQVKNYDGTPAINATLISFSWLAIK
jgi:hypothetical protein